MFGVSRHIDIDVIICIVTYSIMHDYIWSISAY